MKKRFIFAAGTFLIFIIVMAVLAIWAEGSASQLREGVLRLHIVASSDSEADQSNKMAVRDGIATLCSQLFKNSESKAESMEIAKNSSDIIIEKAEQILNERGSKDGVSLSVRKRFFPTRFYDGVSLPAGVYDTVDLEIGKAQGQNFWCVMFPDICIGGSSKNNVEKIKNVLSEDASELATSSEPVIKFKFRLVEIFQTLKNRW